MSCIRDKIGGNEELWGLFTGREEYSSEHGNQRSTFSCAGDSRESILEPWVWKSLVADGFQIEYPGNKKFAVCLTHDVDDVYPPTRHMLLASLHCMRNLNFAALRDQVAWKFGDKARSPYRKFEQIMELEEKYNAKSSFNFLATESDPVRFRYDIEDLESELRMISDSGWGVGLHTGYYSFNDLDEVTKEKERLERVLGKEVIGCRNHYLRFEVPGTWELLSRAGFKYDTTFGYNDLVGFRNGMCGPFKPFNLHIDAEVDILEIPLNIMDRSLFESMRLDFNEAWAITRTMIDVVRECSGVLTVLWHNYVFSCPFREEWARVYEMLLQYCHERDAWIASADDIYKWWTRGNCPDPVV